MDYRTAITTGAYKLWTPSQVPPPIAIWDRIVTYHLVPLLVLSECADLRFVASSRSCYRPRQWEIEHGRSGASLHTFPDQSRGACDVTTFDGSPIAAHLPDLFRYLPHFRFAHYPGHNFVHVDYGDHSGSLPADRSLFTCTSPVSPWIFSQHLPPSLAIIPPSGQITSL